MSDTVDVEIDLAPESFDALEAYAENNGLTIEEAAAQLIEDQLNRFDYLTD